MMHVNVCFKGRERNLNIGNNTIFWNTSLCGLQVIKIAIPNEYLIIIACACL